MTGEGGGGGKQVAMGDSDGLCEQVVDDHRGSGLQFGGGGQRGRRA